MDRRGFTLVELMVAVAIAALLAALAVPEYYQTVLRSRRAELALNLDAISTVQGSYRAEWSAFTSCAMAPAAPPGRDAVDFPTPAEGALDWALLGWSPDGRVRGQYEAVANGAAGELARFSAAGFTDLDADGNLASCRATESVRPVLVTATTVF